MDDSAFQRTRTCWPLSSSSSGAHLLVWLLIKLILLNSIELHLLCLRLLVSRAQLHQQLFCCFVLWVQYLWNETQSKCWKKSTAINHWCVQYTYLAPLKMRPDIHTSRLTAHCLLLSPQTPTDELKSRKQSSQLQVLFESNHENSSKGFFQVSRICRSDPICMFYNYLQGVVESRVLEDADLQKYMLVLFSRRSRLHPGTRYIARGLNSLASPGNEIECEQVWRFCNISANKIRFEGHLSDWQLIFLYSAWDYDWQAIISIWYCLILLVQMILNSDELCTSQRVCSILCKVKICYLPTYLTYRHFFWQPYTQIMRFSKETRDHCVHHDQNWFQGRDLISKHSTFS